MESIKTPELQRMSIPKKLFGYDTSFVDSFMVRARKEIESLKEEVRKNQDSTQSLEQTIKKHEDLQQLLIQKEAAFTSLQKELEELKAKEPNETLNAAEITSLKEELARKENALQDLQNEFERHRQSSQNFSSENTFSSLREELAQKEQTIQNLRLELSHFVHPDQALKEILVIAKRAADEIRQSAQSESEQMLQEARTEAHRIQNQAQIDANQFRQNTYKELEQTKWSLENLKIQKSQYVQKWRVILDEQLNLIDGSQELDEIYPTPSIMEIAAG